MRLFSRSIYALLAVSALTLGSCSDELQLRDSGNGMDHKGVLVYVPRISAGVPEGTGTRVDGSVSAWDPDEFQFTSLLLIAYPIKNGVAGTPETVNLMDGTKCTKVQSEAPSGYDAYTFNLPNGEYRMYVVANTGSAVTGSEDEGTLKLSSVAAPVDASGGIPMVCAHSQLKVQQKGAASLSSITDAETISISSSSQSSTIVQADLTFAVAKVRVTLLNDMRPADQVSSAEVTGHKSKSNLFATGDYDEAGAKFTPASSYYSMPAKSNDGLEKSNVENLTGKVSSPAANSEWAWQTVFYVPQRLVQTSSDYCKIEMQIGSGEKNIIPIGHKDNGNTVVEKSHFYDYVGTPDGKFTLFVEEWTPITIAGALNGPAFLHVNQTKLDIEAGKKTSFWFDSNYPVEWKTEKYGTKDIYKFEYNKPLDQHPDSIRVWLNPSISATEYNAFKDNDICKSFTLSAGNIVKKIDVDLVYEEFININPDMLTIDVNERKTSADYNNYLPITINTNLSQIKVSKTKSSTTDAWPTDAASKNAFYLTQYVNGAEPKIAETSSSSTITVGESGEVTLRLRYNGLNSDNDIWKEDRDFELTIEGTNSKGETVKQKIMIYIRAAYDVYRIHLKATGWSHPHIYVYQCLQLPSTHSTYPNKPVGADPNKEGKTAALEYSFTGAVAFMGWDVNDWTKSDASGQYLSDKYFYYFNDCSDGSWEPSNGLSSIRYYDMDFCSKYRNELKTLNPTCTLCTGDNFAKTWPGIHMKKDPNPPAGETDWWYFELTGVATPGKALIMFTDCDANKHEARKVNDFQVRYPDDDDRTGGTQPGIPLFDFPSKEGWFVYQGRGSDNKLIQSSFTSTEPGASETIYTYRIYWPYSTSSDDTKKWTGLNVWQNETHNQGVWGNAIYTAYPNTQTDGLSGKGQYGKYNDSYVYLEFKRSGEPLTGKLKYQRIKSDNNYDPTQTEINFSSFTQVNGVFSYTITSVGNGKSGRP